MSLQKNYIKKIFTKTSHFQTFVFDNYLYQFKNYFMNPYNKIYLRGEKFNISSVHEKKDELKLKKINNGFKIKCLIEPKSDGVFVFEIIENNSFLFKIRYKYIYILGQKINFNLEIHFTIIDNTCGNNIILYLELIFDKTKIITEEEKKQLSSFFRSFEIWDYPEYFKDIVIHSKKKNIENYLYVSMTVNANIEIIINFIKSPNNIFKAAGTDKYHTIKENGSFEKKNYSIYIFNQKTKQTFTFSIVKIEKSDEGITIWVNETIEGKENSKNINIRVYRIDKNLTWVSYEQKLLFSVNKQYMILLETLVQFYLKKSKYVIENEKNR